MSNEKPSDRKDSSRGYTTSNKTCCALAVHQINVLVALVVTMWITCPQAYAQVDSFWNGGDGSWTDSSNWNPQLVPNGAFNVFIDDGNGTNSLVTIPPTAIIYVDSLTVDNEDFLRLDGSELHIQVDIGRPLSGTIMNEGQIKIASSTRSTRLIIENSAILQGGGTISLDGQNTANISGRNNNGVLTNVDNVIQGNGSVGFGTLQLFNESLGIVDANTPSTTLSIIPPSAGLCNNEGVFRASNEGILVIANAFNNTGGLIEAKDLSTVRLQFNAVVTGGLICSTETGQIEIPISADASIGDLTILGTINQNHSSFFTWFGTINNQGDVNVIGPNGIITTLRISDSVSLVGGGTISLLGDLATIRKDSGAEAVLTNVDNTIQGRGRVGANDLHFVNGVNGVVDANDSNGALVIDPPSRGDRMINRGLMTASSGGELRLQTNEFDNAGGLIHAQEGSTVKLNIGVKVSGGTIQSTGSGQILVPASDEAAFEDLTIDGVVVQQSNADVRMKGTVTNIGSITVSNLGSLLTEDIDGATLTGGGSISLQSSTVIGGVSNSTWTFEDQTISGQGFVGNGFVGFVNHGLIDANVVSAAGLKLTPRSGADGFVNTGTLQASAGGLLVLNGAGGKVFENYGGTIQALADSEVRYSTVPGPQIVGGLVTSADTGFHQIFAALFTNVTNTGQVSVPVSGNLRISETFNNSGTITCAGICNIENGDVTLAGGGTVTLTGSSVIQGDPNSFFVIDDQIIEGQGRIGFDQINFVNNQGSLIHANVAGQEITLDPAGQSDIPWVSGEGTLRASNGSTLRSIHTTIVNGTIDLDNDSVFQCDGNSLTCDSGSLVTGSGRVSTIFQPLNLQGAVAPGNSIGTLTLDGLVSFAASTTIEIELANSTSFDELTITSSDQIPLSGNLHVSLVDEFVPSANDTFVIVNGNVDLSGAFNNVANGDRLLVSDCSGSFVVHYGPGSPFGHDRVVLSDYQMVTTTPAVPTSFSVGLGRVESGGLTELNDSDDQYLILNSVFRSFGLQLQFTIDAIAPTTNLCGLAFGYEARIINSATNVDQKIELFNYAAGVFEMVDMRRATTQDSVVNVVISDGDPSRFVEAKTNNIRARISYQTSLPFWVLRFQDVGLPYQVRVDQAVWSILH